MTLLLRKKSREVSVAIDLQNSRRIIHPDCNDREHVRHSPITHHPRKGSFHLFFLSKKSHRAMLDTKNEIILSASIHSGFQIFQETMTRKSKNKYQPRDLKFRFITRRKIPKGQQTPHQGIVPQTVLQGRAGPLNRGRQPMSEDTRIALGLHEGDVQDLGERWAPQHPPNG